MVPVKTVQELRKLFLHFFADKGHRVFPSSPLIPPQDPTLMFTNAGMVQFKDVFLGKRERPAPAAVTVQKCLRITGKHNDFDEVGFTNRHLTFFEMLGNFSFGAYFKEEAICYAWEFLTQICGLSPDQLLITVHHTDQESEVIWHKKIGVPTSRIFQFDADNFWQMADTGPCGPCSEIHVDLGSAFGPVGGANVVGGKGPRFMEVWNLVFMMHERHADGSQTPLPTPCVDTGAGLERLAAVVQKTESIFGTDEFAAIAQLLARITGAITEASEHAIPFRVVSDHIRSILFLMHEGVLPSNEGRGYVLRRIMRRALRFVGQLSPHSHALSQLLPSVADLYAVPYPEVLTDLARNRDILAEEENRFFEVVQRGSAYLDAELHTLQAKGQTTVPGQVAFVLHDTYGFPIDLTRVVAKEKGFVVDDEGFSQALECQKEQSRRSGKKEDALGILALARRHPQWFVGVAPTLFVGYEQLTTEAKLLNIMTHSDVSEVLLVFDVTPFYPTGGGQVGDVGVIHDLSGQTVAEVDTAEKGFGENIIVHVCRSGSLLQEGARYRLIVDRKLRRATQAHHTATHLLHAALRQVLGTHVRQQGSFVGPQECRFDFAHHKKVSPEELARITAWVQGQIAAEWEVSYRVIPIDQARSEGTLMFFDEKYGDQVRQLRIGPIDQTISLELCGGTHVQNTAEIGDIEIATEQSIAQGMRRLTFLAGPTLETSRRTRAEMLSRVAHALGVSPMESEGAVQRLKSQVEAERDASEQCLEILGKTWAKQMPRDVNVHAFDLPFAPPKKGLKKLCDAVLISPQHVVIVVYDQTCDIRFGSQYRWDRNQMTGCYQAVMAACQQQGFRAEVAKAAMGQWLTEQRKA